MQTQISCLALAAELVNGIVEHLVLVDPGHAEAELPLLVLTLMLLVGSVLLLTSHALETSSRSQRLRPLLLIQLLLTRPIHLLPSDNINTQIESFVIIRISKVLISRR